MATYKGKFSKLKNPAKYAGDPNNIVYRSHWERNVMRWLDENDQVVEWSSEEISFPYDHPIRGKSAKYYPDFFYKTSDGKLWCVEVKPKKQTFDPPTPKRKTKNFLQEKMTWMINNEKWIAARKICAKHDINFEIWTEDTLQEMGILKWETNKTVLKEESTSSKKPKMKPMVKRRTTPRPRRRS